MSRELLRHALLIGSSAYQDSRFAQLPSTLTDVDRMRQVLIHRAIGSFASVEVLADPTAAELRSAIEEFLGTRSDSDLALVYISGHGVRLNRSTGEFIFVAADTDADRVAETGVAAQFVNEQFEASRAPQKVAVLDSCRSGGFAVGFRTRDRDAPAKSQATPPADRVPLQGRGFYVLASSGAVEDSFAGRMTPDGPEPSAFTGRIVDALATGRAARNTAGVVTVDDLFDLVNREMRADGRQVPLKHAQGVNDRIILARSPQGPVTLEPLAAKPAEPPRPVREARATEPDWTQLLAYYRNCVLADGLTSELVPAHQTGGDFVCFGGTEQFLSGTVDEDDCVAVPPGCAELVAKAASHEADLLAGYPVVVLDRGSRTVMAPLVVRRVEVIGTDGSYRLRPYGAATPHLGLARALLSDDDVAELVDTYTPSWFGGQHDLMAVDLKNLLVEDYRLGCVQELRPSLLADELDLKTPAAGARNIAMLSLAPEGGQITAKLIKDLDEISTRPDIGQTALGLFGPQVAERRAGPEPPQVGLVTPLPVNPAQRDVLRAAQSEPITVVTGPPGTGKSQLVVSLVATALAADQTVLIASTNNEAVNEVSRRCDALAPDTVIRTGAAEYRAQERTTLGELLSAGPVDGNAATAAAELSAAQDHLAAIERGLRRRAETERRLLEAGQGRIRAAAELDLTPSDLLPGVLASGDVRRLSGRLHRLAKARLFGEFRRVRGLRRAGLTPPADTRAACRSLGDLARHQADWTASHDSIEGSPDDEAMAAELVAAEGRVALASTRLLRRLSTDRAVAGRRLIDALCKAIDRRNTDRHELRAVLPYVKAWAVTSLSARRFPLDAGLFDLVIIDEASQCAIPQIIPLLYRAKRVVIIGDPQQLTHITQLDAAEEAKVRRRESLSADWLEPRRLSYRRHSAYDAAECAAGSSMLLNEHYRCHPDIAAVSNELFYQRQLEVLTDVRGQVRVPNRGPVRWADVCGEAVRGRNGSWLNAEEQAKVRSVLEYLLARDERPTIGVVTPFRAQKDAIAALVKGLGAGEQVRVGTVHTFQGGECDIIVMSLVASATMKPTSVRWFTQQRNLWNVAITRARSHLIVVGDAGFWQQQGSIPLRLLQAANEAAAPPPGQDPLRSRLYQKLSVAGADVTLAVNCNGYVADACVATPTGSTMVVLDRAAGAEGEQAFRHLRQTFRRVEIMTDPAATHAVRRLAAWQLYDA